MEKNLALHFTIAEKIDRVEVFGRRAPNDERLWVTLKSGQLDKTQFHVKINSQLLAKRNKLYQVVNVMTGETKNIEGKKLIESGFPVRLLANGSTAFMITPL